MTNFVVLTVTFTFTPSKAFEFIFRCERDGNGKVTKTKELLYIVLGDGRSDAVFDGAESDPRGWRKKF